MIYKLWLEILLSSHSFGVFVGIGNRQKIAVYKLRGLKVSHSTQSPLNTLLFRREPWKGRNVPAGVTNGSMLGTVNSNKLLRVTSKYFFLQSKQTKATALVKPKLELGEPSLCWGKTPSYKLCWKHLGSTQFFTLQNNENKLQHPLLLGPFSQLQEHSPSLMRAGS